MCALHVCASEQVKRAKAEATKALEEKAGAEAAIKTTNEAVVKLREEQLKLSKDRDALQKKTQAQLDSVKKEYARTAAAALRYLLSSPPRAAACLACLDYYHLPRPCMSAPMHACCCCLRSPAHPCTHARTSRRLAQLSKVREEERSEAQAAVRAHSKALESATDLESKQALAFAEEKASALERLESELMGSAREMLGESDRRMETMAAEHELQVTQLELSMAEELELALEASEKEHREAIEHAVAHAQSTLNAQHKVELDKASAALEELESLRMRAAELEQTIARLTPRRHAS